MQQADDGVTIGNNPILPSIIHKAWNWPAVYVEFCFDGELVALVSFVKVRKTWVSLPHFDHGSLWLKSRFFETKAPELKIPEPSRYEVLNSLYCGWANQAVSRSQHALTDGAVLKVIHGPADFSGLKELSKSVDGAGMICRNRYPVFSHFDASKVIPSISLQQDYDLQFESFTSNVRRKIRKSAKHGIVVKDGGRELVDDFYAVYRKNIRNLGSFGLPKSFFQMLTDGYRYGFARVMVAALNGKPVGAAILLNFAAHAENGWFASLQEYNRQYVTYAMHDAMIRYAIAQKCKVYSFGRSTNHSSGHRYKKQWGTTDMPMVLSSTQRLSVNPGKYHFVSGLLKVLPDKLLNPLDGFVSKIIY